MHIGLLHPGEMGVTIAHALQASAHHVGWVSAGRSIQTSDRAQGLSAYDSLAQMLQSVDAVISVCPPGAAYEQAEAVSDENFSGIYIDANAISPTAARRIQALFADRFVDGGIIGPPAIKSGTTPMYLSGPRAAEVASWFSAGSLGVQTMSSTERCAASALKMAYAAQTKGSSALLLAVNALARQSGVQAELWAEWGLSQPGLVARSEATARVTSRKAWRFEGEMQEIAQTFADAGLPDGFHLGAAELYARMSELKELPPQDLAAVLAAINKNH